MTVIGACVIKIVCWQYFVIFVIIIVGEHYSGICVLISEVWRLRVIRIINQYLMSCLLI